MASEIPVRLRMLRVLLAMDATVLLAMGALFMAMPAGVGLAFGFRGLPPAACYLIGLWGCALISLGVGYAYAVGDPVRNVTWVRAGIVRGALECVFGFIVLGQHMVTWHQAAFGTVIAGAIAAGYTILYPAETLRGSIYLTAYGLFRFGHEFLRDTPRILAGLTGYQVAAAGCFVLGLVGYIRRRGAGERVAAVPALA